MSEEFCFMANYDALKVCVEDDGIKLGFNVEALKKAKENNTVSVSLSSVFKSMNATPQQIDINKILSNKGTIIPSKVVKTLGIFNWKQKQYPYELRIVVDCDNKEARPVCPVGAKESAVSIAVKSMNEAMAVASKMLLDNPEIEVNDTVVMRLPSSTNPKPESSKNILYDMVVKTRTTTH